MLVLCQSSSQNLGDNKAILLCQASSILVIVLRVFNTLVFVPTAVLSENTYSRRTLCQTRCANAAKLKLLTIICYTVHYTLFQDKSCLIGCIGMHQLPLLGYYMAMKLWMIRRTRLYSKKYKTTSNSPSVSADLTEIPSSTNGTQWRPLQSPYSSFLL